MRGKVGKAGAEALCAGREVRGDLRGRDGEGADGMRWDGLD
jgi:hypothetical protein